MGIKAKIGLLILLVAGVIAVIVWDKSTTPVPKNTARATKDLVIPVPAREELPTVKRTSPPETREPIMPVQPPARPPRRETPPTPPVLDPRGTDEVEIVGPVKPVKPAIDEVPPRDKIPARLDPAPKKYPESGSEPPEAARVTPKNDTPKTPARPAMPDTYVVKAGDTLWDLAKEFYGNGQKWRMILDANKDKLAEGDPLKVKMVLNIPRDTEQPAETTVETKPTIPPEYQGKDIHVVEPGDSLYTIAEKVYGNSSLWRYILEANKERMPDENRLRVGQILVIPKVEKRETPEKPVIAKEPAISPEFAGKCTYTVESGDNLSIISEKFYGSPTKWTYIYEANKDRMKNEHALKIGQVLLIPDLPEKETSNPRTDKSKLSASEDDRTPRRKYSSRLVSD
jgi:nucleoid-associated protein YgaU